MKRLLLFVAKDMGSSNVTLDLALKCVAEGHEVHAVTEGLASKRYILGGITPRFVGTVNFKTEPFTLDVPKMLEALKPDVVVTGLGSPINLEGAFGVVSNALGMPLVECEDFWNGHSRSAANPDLLLTLDEYAAELMRKSHPRTTVEIVGNPGVAGYELAPEVVGLRRHFDRVFVYPGGGDYTTDEIRFLAACLKQTSHNWCLIARFHQKWMKEKNPADGRPYGDMWKEMLQEFRERVVYLDSVKVTETIVAAADGTFSGFSTLLTTSAFHNCPTGSLHLPSVMASLKAQANLNEVPIVKLGCAHSLAEPVDLAGLAPPPPENVAKLKPYNVDAAYAALMAVFK